MLLDGSHINLHDLGQDSCVLDLCYTDPAQNLITAGKDLDDLDRDFSVRSFKWLSSKALPSVVTWPFEELG